MGDRAAWVLVPPDAVPASWAHRGEPLVLLRLLPAEAERLLGGETTGPELSPDDFRLVEIISSGRPAAEAGRILNLSRRTVERRLARLRSHFGVATTPELVARLASAGFGTSGSS